MPAGIFTLHWASNRLPWNLKQELRKAQGAGWFVLQELALPGSTKLYSWGPGVAVGGVGQYRAQITSLDPLRRRLPEREGSLEDVGFGVTVFDEDGSLAAVVEGSSSRLIRGSVATLTLGSANVPQADWFQAFVGVVDRYELTAPKTYAFDIRADDLPLRSFFPRPGIDAADWPGITAESVAQAGPLLYGKHSSVGNTAKGAVPLVKLDSTGIKYLLCWGRAKAVDNVYSDAVLKTLTSDYSISYPTTNSGRSCTMVTFVVAQAEKEVTADVQGYETVGDGSGALIENPVDQIKHALVNWVWNDYKSGNWFAATTAPVDPSYFSDLSARFATAKGSRRIFGDRVRAIDLLNEWAQSWEFRLCWSNGGQIVPRFDNPQLRDFFSDEVWLRKDSPSRPSSINYRPDWEGQISLVTLNYFFSEAAGKYLGNLDVEDLTLGFDAPDQLDLPWSAAYTAGN